MIKFIHSVACFVIRTEILLAVFSCSFRANSERQRVWSRSLIGQWTVHRMPTYLIDREVVFGGVRPKNVTGI